MRPMIYSGLTAITISTGRIRLRSALGRPRGSQNHAHDLRLFEAGMRRRKVTRPRGERATAERESATRTHAEQRRRIRSIATVIAVRPEKFIGP